MKNLVAALLALGLLVGQAWGQKLTAPITAGKDCEWIVTGGTGAHDGTVTFQCVQVSVPAGTAAAPGVKIGSGGGLYSTASGKLGFSTGSAQFCDYNDTVATTLYCSVQIQSNTFNANGWYTISGGAAGGIAMGSGHIMKWASSATNTGFTGDVGFARDQAGVMKVTNGSSGNGYWRSVPANFSTLPSCAAGTEGTYAAVNDSNTATWGATVAGSSTNHILAYCDGTNWTVAGK